MLKQTPLAGLRSSGISLCGPRSEEQSSQVQASDTRRSCSARGRAEAKVVLGSLIPEPAYEQVSPRHTTVQTQGLYLTPTPALGESLSTIISSALLFSKGLVFP